MSPFPAVQTRFAKWVFAKLAPLQEKECATTSVSTFKPVPSTVGLATKRARLERFVRKVRAHCPAKRNKPIAQALAQTLKAIKSTVELVTMPAKLERSAIQAHVK